MRIESGTNLSEIKLPTASAEAVFLAADISIDKAKVLLGQELYDQLLVFPTLHPKAQVRVVTELEELGMPVQPTLRAASIKRKQSDPNFESKLDPVVRELQKGHVVEILAEVSSSGVSREQTGFLKHIANLGKLILCNTDHPDIKPLELAPGSYPVTDRLELGSVNALLKLWESNPDHPAFGTNADAQKLIMKLEAATYALKSFKGKVIEPPCGSNEGIIKLDTGIEIESISAKFINVINVDKDMMLDRNPRELFRGQRVWAYFDRQWHKATVKSPDEYAGMAIVVCDNVVHDNKSNEGGKGLTISISTVGTDIIPTLDEELLKPPSIIHPRDRYPKVQHDACIRFNHEGQIMWGLITGINSVTQHFEIKSSDQGFMTMPFDADFDVLEEKIDIEYPGIKKGNILHAGLDSTGYPQAYKILAIDLENEKVFLHRVDRKGFSRCIDMPLDLVRQASADGRVYDRESEIEAIKRKFPAVAEIDFENCFFAGKVTFLDQDNQIKTWKILSLDTFPAFVELLEYKSQKEIEHEVTQTGTCNDSYNRIQIRPDQFLNWELLSKTDNPFF